MGQTDGRWVANTSFPDLQMFMGSLKFKDLAGLATTPTSIATPGILYQVVPSSDTSIFAASLTELMLRSGVYATPAFDQEQFGTAASVPGPSLVAGTSGPLALQGTFPPLTQAQLATLGNIQTGPRPKGIQIDSVDVIYQPLTVAAASATIGLTATNFTNGVAPVVTNLIALGSNNLPTGIAAEPYVFNVPVPNAGMIVAADTEVLLNINLGAGVGGTIEFMGAVIRAHYNFS